MALPQRYIENVEKDAYTEDEYFEFERRAFGRWEFVPTGPSAPAGRRLGDIRAMSGGTPDHSAIASNIIAALHCSLTPKGCRVFGPDLKVHTSNEVNTFPDVSVVYGPLDFYRGRKDVITNPILVVEVLSDSTEGYDRGEKFDHCRTIPTLTDYRWWRRTGRTSCCTPVNRTTGTCTSSRAGRTPCFCRRWT